MELTNEQRKYLGLELIDPAWEKVEISNSINPEHESGRVLLLRLWTDSARCDAAQKKRRKGLGHSDGKTARRVRLPYYYREFGS